jgi:O-antigen/teichoic acid export membrane protein
LLNKNQILKDIFSYSVSTYLSQSIGMISSIWVASKLGPENFGIYNAILLFLSYAAYSEFGVLSAMGRDLPIYLGKNDLNQAIAIEGAARYTTIIGAIFASLIIFFISLSHNLSIKMSFGMKIIAIVVILQQLYTYHRTVLRCRNNIIELSKQQIINSLITTLLAVLFVFYEGYTGRLYAALIAQALILLYAIYRNPWQKMPKFKFSFSLKIMKVGLPILASGFIISLLTSIDRLMIITFFNATELGYFGLSIMLISIISLIPAMASQVLFPRINFHYGKNDSDIQQLKSFVLKPPLILSAILPFVIGPIFLILPLIITTFLPDYLQGLDSARIVSLGIYFYGILGLTDYFLVTTKKLKLYAIFGIIALIFNISIDYILIKMGYGINGIAFGGTLITYFLYSTIVIGYAISFYKKNKIDLIKYFLKIWGPFFYMLFLLFSIEFLIDDLLKSILNNNFILQTIFKILLYTLFCFPLKIIIESELNIDLSFNSLKIYLKLK